MSLDNTNCLCQFLIRDIGFESKLQGSLLIEIGIESIVSVNKEEHRF